MRSIRCGMGLGDSVYLQGVCRHIIETTGERLQVHSKWPDVFRPLGDKVEVKPFTRQGIKILAHYATRKKFTNTTQFEDCLINAKVATEKPGGGINEDIQLRMDWEVTNHTLVDSLKAHGKPIVCVQLPRPPMDRKDGFGAELLPHSSCKVMQRAIDEVREWALIVQVGDGKRLYDFKNIDVDLAGKTSVSDLIDVLYSADAYIGYCSFIVAFAESFDIPELVVWSRRGLRSKDAYIRQIAPQKILQKHETSAFIFDDCADEQLAAAVSRIRGQVFRGVAVPRQDSGDCGEWAGVAA